MSELRNLAAPTTRWLWFASSCQFERASSITATAGCKTLGECAGLLPRLIADAYLMGGEL